MSDRSGARVTSGRRMVAAATLHDIAQFSRDESMVWADACALLVEDGQAGSVRVLLSRVTDRVTAERVRTALVGRLGVRDSALVDRVEELYRTAVDVPASDRPSWADAGIRVPGGGVSFSGHTLDLDQAESEDGVPWPAITVMAHQVIGVSAGVLLEVGPSGSPCTLRPAQARRVAAALVAAADLVDAIRAGTS